MKVSELKQQIAAASGKLVVSDLTFSHKSEEDIDIHAGTQLLAWVPKSARDDDSVEQKISTLTGFQALERLSELGQIAQFLGIAVNGIKPITIPAGQSKEAIVEDPEKYKLAGKVEAYEKILIGRSITAS